MKRYLSSIVTKGCKSGNEFPLGRIIVAQVVFAACGPFALAQDWIEFTDESCRIDSPLAVTRSMCVTVVAPCLLLLAIPPAIAQTGKRRGIGERVRRGFSVVAWRFSKIKTWR